MVVFYNVFDIAAITVWRTDFIQRANHMRTKDRLVYGEPSAEEELTLFRQVLGASILYKKTAHMFQQGGVREMHGGCHCDMQKMFSKIVNISFYVVPLVVLLNILIFNVFVTVYCYFLFFLLKY